MGFIYPEWLLVLAPVAVLSLLVLWAFKRHLSWVSRLFGSSAAQRKWASARLALRLASLVLLAGALAGPYLDRRTETLTSRQKEIYFLLDVSNSMNCGDLRPSRLQKSKQLILRMTRKLAGERMGLIVFTDYGYTVCPLTRDARMLELFVNLVETRQYGNRGTNFRKALMECTDRFPASKPLMGFSKRYIVMLSDGEHFGEAYQSVINKMKQAGVRLLAVGVGTEQPCAVTTLDENDNQQRVLNESGQPAISRYRSHDLEFLARETGGLFFRLDGHNEPSDEMADYLDQQSASSGEKLLLLQEFNLFAELTFAAFLCWLCSMFMAPIRRRSTNQPSGLS